MEGGDLCEPVLIRPEQFLSCGPWSYLPAVAVDVILHIHTHGTGALVQDGELRLVVEESGHLGRHKHSDDET